MFRTLEGPEFAGAAHLLRTGSRLALTAGTTMQTKPILSELMSKPVVVVRSEAHVEDVFAREDLAASDSAAWSGQGATLGSTPASAIERAT